MRAQYKRILIRDEQKQTEKALHPVCPCQLYAQLMRAIFVVPMYAVCGAREGLCAFATTPHKQQARVQTP